MKLIASPTVLMLASSSSGMATPNLSSTAVAISTIDSESTSRSSVNDFSGVASAGVTPATSSRISARPDWISWVLLTRRVLSLGWGGMNPPSSGTWCPGDQGWCSWQDEHLAGEGQPGAVAEDEREVAGPGLTGLHERGERQRDRGGGRVARLDDVAGDDGVLREAEPLGHRLDDPQVGLVGGEDVDVLRADAGLLHRLLEGLGELGSLPTVDRLSGTGHGRAAGGDLDGVELVAVAAPHHRADARLVGGADHGRTGAVGEDDRRRPVLEVGDVSEPLHADDQGVARGAGPDAVVRDAEGVAEPGAPGVEVEGARSRDAQPVSYLRADARDGGAEAGAGHDDEIELVGRQAAGGDRLATGGDGHLDEGLVLAGPPALGDADPALDPLVVGVHHLGEVVVGDPAPRAVGAQSEDACAGRTGRQLNGHALTSG